MTRSCGFTGQLKGGDHIIVWLEFIEKKGQVNARKLTFREPKSGNARELVFSPQKAADRLKSI